jgi:chromate transporter
VFLKIGTLCFGGGLVIIPLVENEVVLKYGWLTKQEFIDAITLGQVTPGPVIISATFIGYKVSGILGAVVATVSVILPSFLMICFAIQGVKRFRENRYLGNFFRGARAAVIGMVFEASLSIGRSSIIDFKTMFIAAVSLIVLIKYKLNPIWLLLSVAALGLFI